MRSCNATDLCSLKLYLSLKRRSSRCVYLMLQFYCLSVLRCDRLFFSFFLSPPRPASFFLCRAHSTHLFASDCAARARAPNIKSTYCVPSQHVFLIGQLLFPISAADCEIPEKNRARAYPGPIKGCRQTSVVCVRSIFSFLSLFLFSFLSLETGKFGRDQDRNDDTVLPFLEFERIRKLVDFPPSRRRPCF